MKKLTWLLIVLLALGATTSQAQSLVNTSWKTFLGGEVNDTLTLHIKQDSSWVTNTGGAVVVRSACKITKDTVSLQDVEGIYACPGEGVYKIKVIDDMLIFTLVSDPCEGRSGALPATKWAKTGGGSQ